MDSTLTNRNRVKLFYITLKLYHVETFSERNFTSLCFFEQVLPGIQAWSGSDGSRLAR